MPELHDLLERRAQGYEPPPDLLDRVHERRRRRQRNRRIGTTVVALGVAAAAIGGLTRAFTSDPQTVPGGEPRSPFIGTWSSTGGEGFRKTMTMRIRAAEGGAFQVAVHDRAAPECSGGASTLAGAGTLDGARRLVLPSPVLTCDDGSEPSGGGGPPLEERLRNFTLVYDPEKDTVTDPFVLWQRTGDQGEITSVELPALEELPPVAIGQPAKTRGHLPLIQQMVDAINVRDTGSFIDLFGPRGQFNPRGDFQGSSSLLNDTLPVADAELVGAWMAINAAWELQAEVAACAAMSESSFAKHYARFGAGSDVFIHCDVVTRWNTLSLELHERWTFEFRGTTLLDWEYEPLDLSPPERTLPLGYDGLLAWESWLETNSPEDAARLLISRDDPWRSGVDRDWKILGYRFASDGVIPYNPTFADEIEASIEKYLDDR